MLSMTATDKCVDQTIQEMRLDKLNRSKILPKIIAAICAMLNGNGGKVLINIDVDSDDTPAAIQRSSVIRTVEQLLKNIIGTEITEYVNFEENENTVTVFVEQADSLITIDYHLYLPSRTQVVQVPPYQPQEKVKEDIINRKAVVEPVELESHRKEFFKSKECGLSETKEVQFKSLKAESSKRTKLADRMTGKSNKFSCYVSAFATIQEACHIYYGIIDDGTVEGELIPNEEDKSVIANKVEKSINKMIWPEQPKRNVHWEIFFEPVFDDNSKPIPSTFVIVVYIAACLGGVFTEEPESYEVVKGEVMKMSFPTWKKRFLQPIQVFRLPINDSTVKRCTWTSCRTQTICNKADGILVAAVNKGDSIETISNNLVKNYPDQIELQMLIMAKKVMASYRSCSFKKAREVLDEYKNYLSNSTEFWMFDAIRVYLETALNTVLGDVEAVNNILPMVLDQAGIIERGRISAALYLLAATNVLQQKDDGDDNSAVIFSIRALQDLKHAHDLPKVRADMEQKVHISIALFYLGCNRFGTPTKKVIDRKWLKKVECSIKAVRQSIDEGNVMNSYRELQFSLVQSVLFYRKSQDQCHRNMFYLEAAFRASKKAEMLAMFYNFQDIVNWSRECMALFTECLVRTNLQAQRRRKNSA